MKRTNLQKADNAIRNLINSGGTLTPKQEQRFLFLCTEPSRYDYWYTCPRCKGKGKVKTRLKLAGSSGMVYYMKDECSQCFGEKLWMDQTAYLTDLITWMKWKVERRKAA